MQQIVFNNYLDAAMCVIFMLVVVVVVIYGVKAIMDARSKNHPSVSETPFEPMPAAAGA